MYNRYIPNGASYTRVTVPDPPPRPTPPRGETPPPQPPPRREQEPRQAGPRQAGQGPSKRPDPLSSLLSGLNKGSKNAGLAGILEKLKLDDIDTGDILLILILLFLFRDGEDLELVIALGLLLLLGLGDRDKDQSEPS